MVAVPAIAVFNDEVQTILYPAIANPVDGFVITVFEKDVPVNAVSTGIPR